MVPLPETKVQVPVPTMGIFPASVSNVEQVIWFVPAFEVVGISSLVMETVLVEAGQDPFPIDHM